MADIIATQLQGLGEFSGSQKVVTDDSRERPAFLKRFKYAGNKA
jgi:hypothetical protein